MRHPNAAEFLRRWFFILPFAGDWNYNNTEEWPLISPHCGGFQQSPIHLNSRDSLFNAFAQLEFHHYKKPLSPPIEIINNGNSAEIGLRINDDESKPHLTVGDLNEFFEVQAIHFHWGSEGVKGSEHTIDGKRYDLEMHMVHKNSKYPTIEEAREHRDGFIVLAVLFKAVPEVSEHSQAFNELYKALELITKYNSTAEIAGPITIDSFIHKINKNDFFTYKGSLSTPPCSESVLWFVFSDIQHISYDNLRKFWNLFDAKGGHLLNNFRPTQQKNRPVFRERSMFDFFV